MAFTRPWNTGDPTDSDGAGFGAGEIRDDKTDTQERLQGTAANGIVDITGTRTFDTDPWQLRPGVADTASLAAGAIGGLTRAMTYFGLTTVARGGADVTHVSASNRFWETVTGATITIPAPPLGVTGIEHTNGTAITSSDFVIFLIAEFLAAFDAGGDTADSSIYRLYNTTDSQVVSVGDNAATGANATHGTWTLNRGSLDPATNGRQNMMIIGRDTARTVATSYALQFAAIGSAGGAPAGAATRPEVKISLADLRIYAIVFKR